MPFKNPLAAEAYVLVTTVSEDVGTTSLSDVGTTSTNDFDNLRRERRSAKTQLRTSGKKTYHQFRGEPSKINT